jgi:hypothetical protein
MTNLIGEEVMTRSKILQMALALVLVGRFQLPKPMMLI